MASSVRFKRPLYSIILFYTLVCSSRSLYIFISVGKRGKGRPRPRQKMGDEGQIRETQRKGSTTGGVESMDIWTCQKADNLKEDWCSGRYPPREKVVSHHYADTT